MIKARYRKRDGRTVYDVKLRDPNGRHYSRTFETKKAAQDFEASQRVDQARGLWSEISLGRMSFAELAESWLANSVHKRPGSVARDRTVVNRHLVPVLGARQIGSIRPADVQAMVNAWVKVSPPGTVVRHYAVLRAIFNHAVNTDLLGRTPCRGIKVPAAEPREAPLVDAADLARLAAAMPAGLELMPYVGAVLGLRWAEVAGLRVGALNFLARTLTVERQLTRGEGGRMVTEKPKTRAGRRTISVPDWLMDMLSAHLAARGLTGADVERWVFVGPDGKGLDYANWRTRVWLLAVKRCGLVGLRFHDLRHAAGTAMVVGGVDIKTAQARLGHASPLTTLRIYAQATPQADRDAARTVGEVFRPAADASGGPSGRAPSEGLRYECGIVSDATTSPESETPSDQDFSSGARWNRTTDLSIISAAPMTFAA
jgi:integrase